VAFQVGTFKTDTTDCRASANRPTSRADLFLEAAYGREGDDGLDAEVLQGGNVGAGGDFVPSSPITIASLETPTGKVTLAFLARHGLNHSIPSSL
jgi:hypothetical protein